MRARELKAARARLGLSQEKLAKALGVHRVTVAGWENGASPVPKAIGLAVAHLLATRKSA